MSQNQSAIALTLPKLCTLSCSILQPILCADFNVTLNVPDTIPVVGGNPITNIAQPALISCSQFVGYLAVYRVCIAVASFFFLLMLLMFCVFSSKDPRSYIQNG